MICSSVPIALDTLERGKTGGNEISEGSRIIQGLSDLFACSQHLVASSLGINHDLLVPDVVYKKHHMERSSLCIQMPLSWV